MTSQPPEDFTRLPPPMRADDTVAIQLEEQERYGGPGGGGDVADGDGD